MSPQGSFIILVSSLAFAVGVPLCLSAAQTEPDWEQAFRTGEVWARGDGVGYNVSLALSSDGRYAARWVGCLGLYGRAEGTWSNVNGGVELKPSREEGMMRGHLNRLERIALNGEPRLIPPEDLVELHRDEIGERIADVLAFKRSEETSTP